MTKLLYSPIQFLAKSALVVLLVGCMANKDSAFVLASQADEPANKGASDTGLPNVELSAELLYQMLVAEIAGQRGDLDLAGDTYMQLARRTRDPRLAERNAHIAVVARDKVKALDALKLWVDIAPDNLEAREGLVAFLIRNGQADAALPHLEKIVSLTPAAAPVAKTANAPLTTELDNPPEQGFMLVAGMLAREQDKQAALKLMEKFAAAHKDKPDAQFAYSNLAMSTGNLPFAQTLVDDLLQKKPGWINAVALRARILQLQGKQDEALTYLGDAVQANSKNLALRMT